MAVKIGSARIDENGRISGGTSGDQTGKEVSTQDWYLHSKGWVVLRPKDATQAEKIAHNMESACANNNIGYDQNQRNTLYNEASNHGFDCAKVAKKVETDCSALVRVCCKYAGISVGDFNTANEKSALLATGAFVDVTASCGSSSANLKRGDILVTKTKGHTVVVLTNGANVSSSTTTAKKSIDEIAKEVIAGKWGSGTDREARLKAAGYDYKTVQAKVNEILKGGSTAKPANPTPATSKNVLIRDGQIHANNFCGAGIVADGVRGSATKKAGIKVLQQAMNRDYNVKLSVDGVWGNASEKALGKHTVRQGETQYMVTALEILLMLKGYNPHGLENPGVFGSGLKACVIQYQKDHGLAADGIAGHDTFKSLIS